MLEQTLIPPDLSQEEAIFRILNSTEQFLKNVNDVFNRIEQRAASVDQLYRATEARADRIREKIDSLQTLDKAIVLRAPSRFPFTLYEPAKKIFPAVKGCVGIHGTGDDRHSTTPNARLPVDMKRELEERKHMFIPTQIVDQRPPASKKRLAPSSVTSVSELFVHDTMTPAYSDVAGETIGKKQTPSRSIVSRKERDNDYGIDQPALVSSFGGSNPFEYTPESGTVHEPDLPDTLPNLPGVALDVTLADFFISPSMLPDIPQSRQSDSPAISEIPEEIRPIEIATSITNVTVKEETKIEQVTSVNTVQPVTQTPSLPAALPMLSPPPPPAAPPPPPPPPMNLPQTPTPDAGRSDLMAAIRAAGGSGKATLKNAANQSAKQRKTNTTLKEASALSASSTSTGQGGGDLMSSLAKALDNRRKAISGKLGESSSPSRISGAMSRISDLIPEPPNEKKSHNKSAGSDNEDWS